MTSKGKPAGEELSLQHWLTLFDLTKKHGTQKIGGSWIWRIAEAKITCSASDVPRHLLISRPGIFNAEKPKHIGDSLSISCDPNIMDAEIIALLSFHGISIQRNTSPAKRQWQLFRKQVR